MHASVRKLQSCRCARLRGCCLNTNERNTNTHTALEHGRSPTLLPAAAWALSGPQSEQLTLAAGARVWQSHRAPQRRLAGPRCTSTVR